MPPANSHRSATRAAPPPPASTITSSLRWFTKARRGAWGEAAISSARPSTLGGRRSTMGGWESSSQCTSMPSSPEASVAMAMRAPSKRYSARRARPARPEGEGKASAGPSKQPRVNTWPRAKARILVPSGWRATSSSSSSALGRCVAHAPRGPRHSTSTFRASSAPSPKPVPHTQISPPAVNASVAVVRMPCLTAASTVRWRA
mmetsp:Transcript_40459/g.128907  ORF Transcript_40459/g.128907 Transcript_40459/m.128907 type:complete len:203 (-) Transcript_40459:1208-1816(-)